MSDRDPRVDPRPGDVLRGSVHEGHRYERTVVKIEMMGKTPCIHYTILGLGGLLCGQTRSDFIAWAKNAEVLHVAD